MAYFTQDTLDFFTELKANNHKEWFEENKKRYEQSVKKPFKAFVSELLLRLRALDPLILEDASQAIFRINHDVRFSKDKTPYKTHMAAVLSRSGRKAENPGFYLMIDDQKLSIGGGHYMPSKEHLERIRQEIAYNLEEFERLIRESAFVKHFGQLSEVDKNKVVPKELKEAASKQPLIFNKGFWFMKDLPMSMVLSESLMDDLMPYFESGQPLNAYFHQAIEA